MLAPLWREARPREPARPPARLELPERRAYALDVVRRDHGARARLPDQRRRLSVRRDDGEDGPLGGEVLEDLRGEDAPLVLGDEQQERVGVTLEREHLRSGAVGDDLDAISEPKALRVLAVGARERPDESCHDVAIYLGQRLQEGARIAAPEEVPGVRDTQAVSGTVLEPGEVLEVAPVGDQLGAPRRSKDSISETIASDAPITASACRAT